jgi:hypothetical protein
MTVMRSGSSASCRLAVESFAAFFFPFYFDSFKTMNAGNSTRAIIIDRKVGNDKDYEIISIV